MNLDEIYLSTAEAVCNDAIKNTWEVVAYDTDGEKWTISDSSEMTEEAAIMLAEDFRNGYES